MPSASSGFAFKQFCVEHSQCAMKVGTDSIMLGSWVEPLAAQFVLDIGTGSGVLALMLAQKSAVYTQILGVDIDAGAIQQATKNALRCPWPEKLAFCQIALQQLADRPNLRQCFDVIVSNPPYFAQNPAANQQNELTLHSARVSARQTGLLEHAELIERVNTHLNQEGHFYCVLPAENSEIFIQTALAHNLYLNKKLLVQSRPGSKFSRVLLKFSRYPACLHINRLTIYSEGTHYSDAYVSLCKAFYVRF